MGMIITHIAIFAIFCQTIGTIENNNKNNRKYNKLLYYEHWVIVFHMTSSIMPSGREGTLGRG